MIFTPLRTETNAQPPMKFHPEMKVVRQKPQEIDFVQFKKFQKGLLEVQEWKKSARINRLIADLLAEPTAVGREVFG